MCAVGGGAVRCVLREQQQQQQQRVFKLESTVAEVYVGAVGRFAFKLGSASTAPTFRVVLLRVGVPNARLPHALALAVRTT